MKHSIRNLSSTDSVRHINICSSYEPKSKVLINIDKQKFFRICSDLIRLRIIKGKIDNSVNDEIVSVDRGLITGAYDLMPYKFRKFSGVIVSEGNRNYLLSNVNKLDGSTCINKLKYKYSYWIDGAVDKLNVPCIDEKLIKEYNSIVNKIKRYRLYGSYDLIASPRFLSIGCNTYSVDDILAISASSKEKAIALSTLPSRDKFGRFIKRT